MQERTLLIAENLPVHTVEEEILSRCDSIVAVVVRDRDKSSWMHLDTRIGIASESDIMQLGSSDAGAFANDRFAAIYHELVSDPRTSLILERLWKSSPFVVEGSYKNASRLAIMVWNALAMLARWKPTRIVCASTPHVPADWILVRAGETLGLPVTIVGISPLLWRSWCVDGLTDQRPMSIKHLMARHERRHRSKPIDAAPPTRTEVDRFIEMNRGSDYLSAVPTIDRAVQREALERDFALKASQSSKRSPIQTARLAVTSPRRFAARSLVRQRTARDKNALLTTYRRLAGSIPRTKYLVSLFLHYQPERTTMPEGGVYAVQLALARMLAATMPAGWTLAIKEHPATFVGPGYFNRAFRDPFIYEAMARLPATTLVPLSQNSFELIDESDLVATITGTVGLQSLSRGTPVVAFGSAAYSGAPGAFSLQHSPDSQPAALARVFSSVERGETGISQSAFRRYLFACGANSIGQYGAVSGEDEGSGEFVPTFRSRAQAASLLIR